MTAMRYYITTLGDWRRHAARFSSSHWLALGNPAGAALQSAAPGDATPILALVEADEGAHFALEDDAAFEALPHALAAEPLSPRAQAALAARGLAPLPPPEAGAGPARAATFDVAQAAACLHPLLRHRVF